MYNGSGRSIILDIDNMLYRAFGVIFVGIAIQDEYASYENVKQKYPEAEIRKEFQSKIRRFFVKQKDGKVLQVDCGNMFDNEVSAEYILFEGAK